MRGADPGRAGDPGRRGAGLVRHPDLYREPGTGLWRTRHRHRTEVKRFNVRPAGYPYVSRVIYAGTYFYYYPTYDAAVAPIWPRARHGWRW